LREGAKGERYRSLAGDLDYSHTASQQQQGYPFVETEGSFQKDNLKPNGAH
jgi:hypothetical protein